MWFSGKTVPDEPDSSVYRCLVAAESTSADSGYNIENIDCNPQNPDSDMLDPSLYSAEDGSLWLIWSENDAFTGAASILARQLSSSGTSWYTDDDPVVLTLATVSQIEPSSNTVNGVTYHTAYDCENPDTCSPDVENPQVVYNPSSTDDPLDVFVSYGSWNGADSYRTFEFGCTADLIGEPSDDATMSSTCEPTEGWDVSAFVEGPGNPDSISNPGGLSTTPDGDDHTWALFAAGSSESAQPRGLYFEPASTVP